LRGLNIGVFALEVPTSCLLAAPGPGFTDVLSGWATVRLLDHTPMTVSNGHAPGKQTSRLANPLVNELFIGLDDKDLWNELTPADDAVFLEYIEYPTFPTIVDILFRTALGANSSIAPNNYPRNDLVAVFNLGVPGITAIPGGANADMIRLNTTIPPTAQAAQNHYGVVAGDAAGFPNGRRPGDDIVDIAIRAAMGVLCTLSIGCVPANAPVGGQPFTDGAPLSALDFDAVFPYLTTPLPGAVTDPNPTVCTTPNPTPGPSGPTNSPGTPGPTPVSGCPAPTPCTTGGNTGNSATCPVCPTAPRCNGAASNVAISLSLLVMIIASVLLF